MFASLRGEPSSFLVILTHHLTLETGMLMKLVLNRKLIACLNTRAIRKQDMILNDWLPVIEVDAQTYEVRANGELLTCEPATVLPLAQRYSLF